ncbi:hypothetical protein PMIN07_011186 [Paraphaeosphaeria minitans]
MAQPPIFTLPGVSLKREADSSRAETLQLTCPDDSEMIALICKFLASNGGAASRQLLAKHFGHSIRVVRNFPRTFWKALRTVANQGENADEYKLKHDWIASLPSPEELPMINCQHLFSILLPQGASHRGNTCSKHSLQTPAPLEVDLDSTSAPKLRPRITRSEFLEAISTILQDSPDFQWYNRLKALLADPRSLAKTNPDEVPVINSNSFYTTFVVGQVVRQSDLYRSNAMANAVDRWLPFNELCNSIHPLLSRERWLDVSDQHWHLLQPVLRLASMFLTTPSCWSWYEHVAAGVIKRDHNGRAYIDPPAEQLTKEQRQHAVRSILSNLAETTYLSVGDDGYSVDTTAGFKTNAYCIAEIDLDNPDASHIVLSPEKFKTLHALGRSSFSQRGYLFIVFGLAVTVLHEIANLFYCASHRFASRTLEEPSFQRDGPLSRVREMGNSWEQVSFGYSFSPLWDTNGPLTLLETSLADMSAAYPGHVDVGSTDVDDFCQSFTPQAWPLKWFRRRTWDRIARDGLGFMKEEATSYTVRAKKDYPILGWCMAYNTTPHDEYVHAIAWPYAGEYTKYSQDGVHFTISQLSLEDEQGFTIQEKEFALAWAATYGKLDMKALLADREVCTKHAKRQREDDTGPPDENRAKKHKMKEPENPFTSNYALLENHNVGAFHRASMWALGRLNVEAFAAEFAEHCEEDARTKAFVRDFDNMSVEELILDVTTATRADGAQKPPFPTCEVMLNADEKRLRERGHLKGAFRVS